jgi:hypothetical protein
MSFWREHNEDVLSREDWLEPPEDFQCEEDNDGAECQNDAVYGCPVCNTRLCEKHQEPHMRSHGDKEGEDLYD